MPKNKQFQSSDKKLSYIKGSIKPERIYRVYHAVFAELSRNRKPIHRIGCLEEITIRFLRLS